MAIIERDLTDYLRGIWDRVDSDTDENVPKLTTQFYADKEYVIQLSSPFEDSKG